MTVLDMADIDYSSIGQFYEDIMSVTIQIREGKAITGKIHRNHGWQELARCVELSSLPRFRGRRFSPCDGNDCKACREKIGHERKVNIDRNVSSYSALPERDRRDVSTPQALSRLIAIGYGLSSNTS